MSKPLSSNVLQKMYACWRAANYGRSVIYVTGARHGGPALVAETYLGAPTASCIQVSLRMNKV